MKKIFPILLIIVLFIACNNLKATPTGQVEDFFAKYQKLDPVVVSQLDDVVNGEANLTANQRKRYREAIQRQYKNLAYEVKDEVTDGDTATVTVEVEVYDYHKALRAAQQYLADNPNKFQNTDNSFNESSYFDYRINQMMKTNEKIKYTLNLSLTKQNDKWVLDNLSEMDREKIHGLYNYS